MTVTYTGTTFKVYDGEETVADLTAEKGSPPATTDTTYIYTDTTQGILGIENAEKMVGVVYAGKDADGVRSTGRITIYAGGEMERTGDFEIVEDYGELYTSGTTSASKAVLDTNEQDNDLKLNGDLQTDYLQVTNIKSNKYIDFNKATGDMFYTEFAGKSSANFYFIGVPSIGWHCIGADVGEGYSGIYSTGNYPNIDLSTDNALTFVQPRKNNSFTYVSMGGRTCDRTLKGAINPTVITTGVRIGSTKMDQTANDLEVLHSKQVPLLIVLRAHGTDKPFPVDYMIRGYFADPLLRYNPGVDFREINLQFMEVA